VSSQEKEIKVTDKRMFTPDGELREEYRFLAEKSTAAPEAEAAPEAPKSAPAPASPPPSASPILTPAGTQAGPAAAAPQAAFEPDFDMDPEMGEGPQFYDLVSMLAEPIPLYLGDMDLPNGQTVENLDMARVHIDLLDVLRQKTTGNLTAQEAAFLEDLLYRARVRYVQKTR
jgi:hypothetical protein